MLYMKSLYATPSPSAKLLVSVIAALAASGTYAQTTFTWDSSPDAGVQAGSGAWNTSATNWTSDAGATRQAWLTTDPTAVSNLAVFGGADGDYTISLTENVSINRLSFNSDGYKLSADTPVTIGFYRVGNLGDIDVAAGKTAEIGANITVSRLVGVPATGQSGAMNLRGGGTLRLFGALVQNNANNYTMFNGSKLIIENSGSATFGSSVVVGSDATTGASLEVKGGAVLMANNTSGQGNLILGNVAGSTLSAAIKISGGSLLMTGSQNLSGVRFGSTTGNAATNLTGTIDLDGGVFQTNRFFEGSTTGTIVSTVNFNGGELKIGNNPNAAFLAVDNTVVKEGGVIINTDASAANDGSAAKTVSLGNSFNEDAGSPGGGFEKIGAGSINLSGSSNYTGLTRVSGGSLIIGSGGAINSTSGIRVDGGATFTNNSATAITKALTIGEGATINGTGAVTAAGMTFNASIAGGLFTAAILGDQVDKGGQLTFSLTDVQVGTFTVFSGSSIGGSFSSVFVGSTQLTQNGNLFSGTVGLFNYVYDDAATIEQLTISAIPEPSAFAVLAGLGALGFAASRRCRR